MTTRADVITAIEAVEARVQRLAPGMLAHADVPLLDGEWNVREALCHLAGRANSVLLATAIAERVRAAQSQGQPPSDRGSGRSADINQAQINDRQGRSVPDLLQEIHEGHLAAIQAVGELDQQLFEQRVPRFTAEGDMSLGELILRAGPGHDNEHLDQVERVAAA
jgi:hypothetical protein